MTTFAKPRPAEDLMELARQTRAMLRLLFDDLSEDELWGPPLPTVNPPIWEIGHVAWFHEYWLVRHWGRGDSRLAGADGFYSSSDVLHQDRWSLALPDRERTRRYLEEVFSAVEELIYSGRFREDATNGTYFALLCIYHECMHAEALTFARQTLGYHPPRFHSLEHDVSGERGAPANGVDFSEAIGPLGDAELPGGEFILGSSREEPFVFDNEKWAHAVSVAPFRMARTPVSQGEYFEFVEDDGYLREELWSSEGWSLRQRSSLDGPCYCRKVEGEWQRRIFDAWRPVRLELPIVHVSWYEAEAFCRWAGRRLPTEAEWEMSACMSEGEGMSGDSAEVRSVKPAFPWGDEPPIAGKHASLDYGLGGTIPVSALADGDNAVGCRQLIGNVWEWTATDFMPYPGFTTDPYRDYSYPWFLDHKVTRGGSWATRSCLIRNTYRNFYKPERNDIYVGFRTCAMD